MASVILAGTTSTTALNLTGDTSGELQLKTNNGSTTAMTLTTGGNVGVGTTSPAQKLDVNGGASSTYLKVTGQSRDAYFGQDGTGLGIIQAGNASMYFNTNATERMRIDASGNVGIGISGPTYLLDTRKDQNAVTAIRVQNQSSGSSAYTAMYFGNDLDLATAGFFTTSSTNATFGGANTFNIWTQNNASPQPIVFCPASTERMRITSGGDVGIGTSSPSAKVQIFKNAVGANASTVTAANTALALQYDSSTVYGYHYMNGGGVYFIDARNNGVAGGNICLWGQNEVQFRTAGLDTDTPRMVINSSGNVGINTSSPAQRLHVSSSSSTYIQIQNTGNSINAYYGVDTAGGWVGTSTNHYAAFYTNNSERMRITTTGALLVGTSIAVDSTDNVHKIGDVANGTAYARLMMQERAGNWISFNDGAGTHYGTIARSGGGVSYGSNSDYRLKENIAPMTGALAKVAQLKPCTYTWKETGKQGDGFIAHELQEVCPDAVVGEKDAINPESDTPMYQQVDTSYLVATLTAAIQEQQAIITDLKQRIETLEAK